MCAYPAAFGVPSCAQPFNNVVLREEWGWDGFVPPDLESAVGFPGWQILRLTVSRTDHRMSTVFWLWF